MQVNSTIVLALVQLRELDLAVLARIAHVPHRAMLRWVQDADETALTFEQQIEVLNYLGIRGEAPRPDVVHYWHLHEGFFSRASQVYAPLNVVLSAFGPAEVIHLEREVESPLTLRSEVYFALKFAAFNAMLCVSTHPLRSVSLEPGRTAGLSWAEEARALTIPVDEYDAFEPGALKVPVLEQRLQVCAEMAAWEQLRVTAMTRGLRADNVAAVLLCAPGNAGLAQEPVAPADRIQMTAPSAAAAPAATAVSEPAEADELEVLDVAPAAATATGPASRGVPFPIGRNRRRDAARFASRAVG